MRQIISAPSYESSLLRDTRLANGNYVVCSPYWNGYNGAVTWGNGVQGYSGTVSAANSLVGTNSNDRVGSDGIFALPNGHYVVASSYWSNSVGAATWCDGSSGRKGAVSSVNSLIGSLANDFVGHGITVLNNGN